MRAEEFQRASLLYIKKQGLAASNALALSKQLRFEKHPSMAFMNKWIAVNQAHLKRSHYHLVIQRCWFGQGGASQLPEPLIFPLLLSLIFFYFHLIVSK